MTIKEKKVKEERESWSNIIGFIIAAVSGAVGLGNYWRMPYLASQYGYISFFIAFIISVFLIGLPIMFVELTAGKKFRTSFIKAYNQLKFPLPGYLSFLLIIILTSYYVVVAGWVFAYVFTYPFYTLSFQDLVEMDIAPLGYVFVLIISAVPVYLGVREGIEKFSKIFMTLLFLITLFLFFITVVKHPIPKIVLSLPTDINVWLFALSQAFFSLSVGFGVMFTYASYIKQRTSIFFDSLVIGLTDAMVGLVVSFVVFVLLNGVVNTQGPILVFDVMSKIFENHFIGWLFYFSLLIAAITSVISLIEFIVSNLNDYGLDRKRAVVITVLGILILSLPSALSYSTLSLKIFNIPVLDFLDKYIIASTSWLGIFFITYFMWRLDMDEFLGYLGIGNLGKYVYYWCKYVLPLFGIVMLYISLKFVLGLS